MSSSPGTPIVDVHAAASRRPVLPGPFLGVAVEEYPGTSWKSLPGAIAEVERVSGLVSETLSMTNLTGLAATPTRILDGLERVQVAHLACHGLFDREHPHRSRLLVADTAETTGDVTLADIQVRNLAKLKRAVLASCWTVSAAVLPGQEVVCLPAAFLRAVVAPLWEVEDTASDAFMADFYYAAKTVASARALAEVQRKWVREDPRGHGMAFRWAALVHHGQAI